MRRLLVHIGCAKGGSSAIQRALRLNCEELASRGIAVPGHDLKPVSEVTGSHGQFFESCVQDRRAIPVPEFGDLLEAEADRLNASTVVLSAENLSNPMGFEKLFEELTHRFDIKILLYVRRQDDFLASSWQQWDIKLGGSLLAWMIRNIRVRGNWYAVIEPWATALGDDRITARVYDRDRLLMGDVFLDFCDVLGQDAAGLQPPGEANPGLNAMLSRMIEGSGHLFEGPHDQSFYDSVRQLAPELVEKASDGSGLFSPDEANAIMNVYAHSNERFRQRYLPQIKRPLFPVRRPVDEQPPRDQAAFERQLLQLQIFNLYKEVNQLRQDLAPSRPLKPSG